MKYSLILVFVFLLAMISNQLSKQYKSYQEQSNQYQLYQEQSKQYQEGADCAKAYDLCKVSVKDTSSMAGWLASGYTALKGTNPCLDIFQACQSFKRTQSIKTN